MNDGQIVLDDFRHWAKTKTEGTNIWHALMWNLRPQHEMPRLLEVCQGKYEYNQYLTIEALACIINLLEEDQALLKRVEGIGGRRLEQLANILSLATVWQVK